MRYFPVILVKNKYVVKLIFDYIMICTIGIPVDRCLWRKNGRIVNLYSEKYDLIGKKAAGDCSVRCEIQLIRNMKS